MKYKRRLNMKTKILLSLLAGLLVMQTSCKKNDKTLPTPVQGKWYQVKLDIYEPNGTGGRLYNTVYLQPFTTLDYVQINDNGTVNSSVDHYYYINKPGQMAAPQAIPAETATWNYTAAGTKFVLSQPNALMNYAGFSSRDTLSIVHNDTLLWRSVSYGPTSNVPNIIYDSYYVK
jgi:hypothetical protein